MHTYNGQLGHVHIKAQKKGAGTHTQRCNIKDSQTHYKHK